MAGWKNPRRGVYRRVRLHFAQSSSGHRSKCRMRFLLGPCGALCAQIWPLGGQNRARGTFASLRTDGEISEVPRNTPFFHQLLGRNKHFPAFPSMIRACYGRCESLTTFQCQVVENEAWPQTDRSLELPPVKDFVFELIRTLDRLYEHFSLRNIFGTTFSDRTGKSFFL